jgi:hypothetical protein
VSQADENELSRQSPDQIEYRSNRSTAAMEADLDGGGARRHRRDSGTRMVPTAMTKSGGG